MIRKWFRAILGLGEREDRTDESSIAHKCRGLQNMKRLNDLVLSGKCDTAQLTALEMGAETISLNLKKGTDKVKKKEGSV